MAEKIMVDRAVLEQALALVNGPEWGSSEYMDGQVYDDADALARVLESVLGLSE